MSSSNEYDVNILKASLKRSNFLYAPFQDSPINDWVNDVDGDKDSVPKFDSYVLSETKDSIDSRRVLLVKFYAAWCGHCKHYKPTFEKLNDAVTSILDDSQVSVIAVACNIYNSICSQHGVHGFPSVQVFRYDDSSKKAIGTTLEGKQRSDPDTGAEFISKMYSSNKDNPASTFDSHKDTVMPKYQIKAIENIMKSKGEEMPPGGNTIKVGDEPKSPSELTPLDDATASLLFTLANNIFTDSDPLSHAKSLHLLKSLRLFNAAIAPIPAAFALKSQLSRIILAIDEYDSEHLQSSNALRDLVLADGGVKSWGIGGSDPNNDLTWSDRCTSGYTCGLWELFHIVTVGTSTNDTPFTPHASAEIIRNFVANFFPCSICQVHFLQMYDGCEFGRCEHLVDKSPSSSLTRDERIALPLFFWEAHNDVNLRLYREECEREGVEYRETIANEQKRWPSPKVCKNCFSHDNSYEVDEIYSILKKTYSSAGSTGAFHSAKKQMQVLDSIEAQKLYDNAMFSFAVVVGLVAVFFTAATRKVAT